MTRYQMSLDYTLNPGWMAPFIEGLHEGRAVARACTDCARVSFPPLKTCLCGGREGLWRVLSGRAEFVTRTTGSDGDFALAQFEGASGLATLRLADMPVAASHGQLRPATGPVPQLILGPERTT